jgi:hypothetical protein
LLHPFFRAQREIWQSSIQVFFFFFNKKIQVIIIIKKSFDSLKKKKISKKRKARKNVPSIDGGAEPLLFGQIEGWWLKTKMKF